MPSSASRGAPLASTTVPRAHARKRGRPAIDKEFDSREAILVAAHELFLKRSGLRVSLTDICTAAGVNVAMVHYHFGSKQGLLVMLFERLCASWAQELPNLMSRPLTPKRKLELHVEQIIRNYRRYPYATRLMAEVVSMSKAAPARRLSNNFMRPLTDFYRHLIEEGVATGEFRQVDPEFFFFSLVGACEFFFAAKRLLEPIFDNQVVDEKMEAAFGRHTIDLLISGMAPLSGVSGSLRQKAVDRLPTPHIPEA